MNQILFPEKIKYYTKDDKKTIKILKIQFIIIIAALISFLIYYGISYYHSIHKHNLSNSIIDSYDIIKLYSANNTDYSIVLPNGEKSDIIGIIEIPELSLKYPILADISDELLKVSLCRFFGPNVNKIGNLCIAGHNYNDNSFFSNLDKLNIDDEIVLTDLNDTSVTYKIYDKFETSVNDTSSTNQNTAVINLLNLTASLGVKAEF